LNKASKRSTIYSILSSLADETVDALPQIKPDLQEKITTFNHLKKIKPMITGKDLRRYKFKEEKKYQRILKKVFSLQLDKEIRNRKQAIEYLKAMKKR
jgi:hypothetical protein